MHNVLNVQSKHPRNLNTTRDRHVYILLFSCRTLLQACTVLLCTERKKIINTITLLNYIVIFRSGGEFIEKQKVCCKTTAVILYLRLFGFFYYYYYYLYTFDTKKHGVKWKFAN